MGKWGKRYVYKRIAGTVNGEMGETARITMLFRPHVLLLGCNLENPVCECTVEPIGLRAREATVAGSGESPTSGRTRSPVEQNGHSLREGGASPVSLSPCCS